MSKNSRYEHLKKNPHKGLHLSESRIRYAIQNSNSASEAARFLHVNILTFKRYASLYVDKDTGMSLYEIAKNPSGRGILKRGSPLDDASFLSLLKGEGEPIKTLSYFKKLVWDSNILEKECSHCGFSEERVYDGKMPLKLVFKDGDTMNQKFTNLEYCCYNCLYLLYDKVLYKKTFYL